MTYMDHSWHMARNLQEAEAMVGSPQRRAYTVREWLERTDVPGSHSTTISKPSLSRHIETLKARHEATTGPRPHGPTPGEGDGTRQGDHIQDHSGRP